VNRLAVCGCGWDLRRPVISSDSPFGGPEHVLQYLARYTHRVAISNHRLLSVNQSQVRFRWRDYKNHNKKRTMTLTGEESLRRFLQHVLPKGLPRIRCTRGRCKLLGAERTPRALA
jgi:putative transposase